MEDFMFKRMFSIPDSTNMLRDFLSSCIDFKNKPLNYIQLIDKEIKDRFVGLFRLVCRFHSFEDQNGS